MRAAVADCVAAVLVGVAVELRDMTAQVHRVAAYAQKISRHSGNGKTDFDVGCAPGRIQLRFESGG